MKQLWAPWRFDYVGGGAKPDMCIFCYPEDSGPLFVRRTKHASVILNKFPYNNGHLLVSPARHVSDLTTLTDEESVELMQQVKLSIEALKSAYSPEGFNVGMNIGSSAGAGIKDHLHMHVVPRWNGDTNFMPVLSDVKIMPQHLESAAKAIRMAFERLNIE